MSLKAQAVSGVKWNGLSMAVVTTLQYITLAILAGILTPSDFGLMGMVMVVIGFAQLFADMGISNAIIYRQESSRNELSSLYWMNILAGAGVFLIVRGATPWISAFYREPRLGSLIGLSSLLFLIVPFGQQFQVLLQKDLLFDHLAKIEIIGSFTNSLVAIALALIGSGVFSLIWGQLAGTTISVVLLARWGRKHWRPSFHFARKDLKGYLGFGLYQMGEKAVNYFNSNLDYLLIGSMLGAQSLGYYTLAHHLVLRPSQKINPILTKVAFPVFSKVKNDIQKLKSGYLKMLRLVAVTNFPIMAGLAVVAPAAVPVVFGEQWLPSVILIQILAVVGLLRAMINPVGSILLARGRADLSFRWNLALMVTQVPGLYVGARLGGTVGVAAAFSILMCLYALVMYPVLVRRLLGPCLKDYAASLWPAVWMSGVMALAVLLWGFIAGGLPLQALLITQILCGLGVYSLLIIVNQKELIAEVKSVLRKRDVVVAPAVGRLLSRENDGR